MCLIPGCEAYRTCHYCGQRKPASEFVSRRKCLTCASTKTCRECGRTLSLDHFSQFHGKVCHDCFKAYRQRLRHEQYARARDATLAQNKPWKQENAPRYRSQQREYRNARRAEIKRLVLEHYGARCACCGETQVLFLTIDHVNDDGCVRWASSSASS